MLKNIKLLTWLFVKGAFTSKTSSKKSSKISGFALYGFLVIYLVGIVIFGSYMYVNSLIVMKQTTSFLAAVMMLVAAATLMVAFVQCMNVMYFSRDNVAVLPLPVTGKEILAAKMNTMLFFNLMVVGLLGMIPMTVYGVMMKMDILFYPIAYLVVFFLPIIPLSLVTLIMMAFMYAVRKMPNKKIVQTIIYIITILLTMVFSYFSGSMSGSGDMDAMIAIAEAAVNSFRKFAPTISWGIDALIYRRPLYLLLLIAVSLIIYCGLIILSDKMYYAGMVSCLTDSSGISNKKLDEKKAYDSKGLAFSYIRKEIVTYLRRPVYVVQLILPEVLMPLFLGVMLYFSINSVLLEQGMSLKFVIEIFTQEEEFIPYIISGILIAMYFCSMYNFISLVAISKDGAEAKFTKFIPVPFYKQVLYKICPDILMGLFAHTILAILLIGLYRIPVMMVLFSYALTLPSITLHSGMILLDLAKPKLQWDNEIQITKNNFRFFYTIAYGLLNIALIVFFVFIQQYDAIIVAIIIFAIEFILSLILFLYIRKKDIQLAKNIS